MPSIVARFLTLAFKSSGILSGVIGVFIVFIISIKIAKHITDIAFGYIPALGGNRCSFGLNDDFVLLPAFAAINLLY